MPLLWACWATRQRRDPGVTRAPLLALAAPLLLLGCGPRRTTAVPPLHYVVGAAYQAGGVWYYPREDFQYDATGLAIVLPDGSGLTADGEAFDSMAMAAAHPTLQLPAIARITNLETGLQVLVRINDRGPANPARLIGLTRTAARRLGIPSGGIARVRVQVEDGPSQALRDGSRDPKDAGITPAPRGGVMAEPLAPPPGVAQSSRGRSAPGALASAPAAAGTALPSHLPDIAVQVAAASGQLWIRAGEFSLAGYADQVRARLGGGNVQVEASRQGRSDVFRVRAGPFADVAAADIALDRARRAGVTDAHIVVE